MIAIDGNEANIENRVGSNEYAFKLLIHLFKEIKDLRLKGNKPDFKCIVYLKDQPLSDLPAKTDWWQYRVLKPKILWTRWRLPLELVLNKKNIDVFFTPGHYSPLICPAPLVMAIMDLAFLRFPDQFRKKDLYKLIKWTKDSVKKAAHIIAISEFSKKEIVNLYNYPSGKITVVYPGTTKLKEEKQESFKSLKSKYKLQGKYFFYLGTLQPRKNLLKLIEAFKKLSLKYSNYQLVVAGKKGWLYDDIFKKVGELNLKDKIVFTDYISKGEKNVLLKNSQSLVLPSLYEGFGIPVLEAMQLGCPVIISNTSSLPEVGGEAALYINNPESVDCIYQALEKMVELNLNEREKLIKLGFEQIKKFSWEKSAQKVLKELKYASRTSS